MTLAGALSAAAARGLERLDAQLLLLHALGRGQSDRAWLLAHDTEALSEDMQSDFRALCERRAGAEPLAYIVGHKEFFGLDLMVDRRVLVPRPDTETLVEWALEVLPRHPRPDPGSSSPSATWIADQACPGLRSGVRNDSPSPRVIDLGTGSGAIALAIKQARPHAVVDAVDSSPGALEVARANAGRLGLDVNFSRASWLDGNVELYDLIVSNPPYVAQADPHLRELRHEPLIALAAGLNGLQDIRIIIGQAPARLRPGGWLMLEHGWDQAEAVRGLLRAAGLQGVATRQDLAGIGRCSGGRWLELG